MSASANGYHMPAEFSEQSAVWFGWPTFQWFEDSSMDTREPIAKVIKALSEHGIKSEIMCKSAIGEAGAKTWLARHGFTVTANMKFPHIDQVDIWVRDFGPIFLRKDSYELGMVSFLQDQWGYSTTTDPVSVAMTAVPGKVAKHLGIKDNFPVAVASEGGSRIVNGQGTLLVNRVVEFQRNPHLSEAELEAAFKGALGVSKVIWLNIGVREDLHATWGPIPYVDATGKDILLYGPQTTGGHLDEFVRFASPNKIVLVHVTPEEAARDPIAGTNYPRLEEAYRILAASTDQDGNPFEIVRIPSPDVEYRMVNCDDQMYGFLKSLTYPPSVPLQSLEWLLVVVALLSLLLSPPPPPQPHPTLSSLFWIHNNVGWSEFHLRRGAQGKLPPK